MTSVVQLDRTIIFSSICLRQQMPAWSIAHVIVELQPPCPSLESVRTPPPAPNRSRTRSSSASANPLTTIYYVPLTLTSARLVCVNCSGPAFYLLLPPLRYPYRLVTRHLYTGGHAPPVAIIPLLHHRRVIHLPLPIPISGRLSLAFRPRASPFGACPCLPLLSASLAAGSIADATPFRPHLVLPRLGRQQ